MTLKFYLALDNDFIQELRGRGMVYWAAHFGSDIKFPAPEQTMHPLDREIAIETDLKGGYVTPAVTDGTNLYPAYLSGAKTRFLWPVDGAHYTLTSEAIVRVAGPEIPGGESLEPAAGKLKATWLIFGVLAMVAVVALVASE